METVVRNTLVIYTDVLNEANDQSVKSRLYSMMEESVGSYRAIYELKEKL
jgi:hypothetical protein